MTFRYNKNLLYHIVLTVMAYLLLIQSWGWGIANLIILLVCGISTFIFNCHRIDITKERMTIFQLYGGRTDVLWNDIDLIEIGNRKSNFPKVGKVRNMIIVLNDKTNIVINIEPIYGDKLIEQIKIFGKSQLS